MSAMDFDLLSADAKTCQAKVQDLNVSVLTQIIIYFIVKTIKIKAVYIFESTCGCYRSCRAKP